MYIVIDMRNGKVKWNGSKKDCKKYIAASNPFNVPYYKIVKVRDK